MSEVRRGVPIGGWADVVVAGAGGGLSWWAVAVLAAHLGALTNAWILLIEIFADERRDGDYTALAPLTAGWSVPQYLHLVAAAGRSSERHAGHVFTGAGSPNTVSPRRAMIALYGTTMKKYRTAMNTMK